MKVFVAGATGAIGAQLVPQLAGAGHDVVGMTRSSAGADAVRRLGARPVVADALDREAVARAVAETGPDVIVHELTALKGQPGVRDLRNPDRFAAMTNRLRTEGTAHLLAAGRAVGIRRFVAQSIVAIGTYACTGGPVKTEDDPPDTNLPATGRSAADAIRQLEDAVTGIDWADGVVLRYGGFYGRGTGLSTDPDALLTRQIRKRRFPIVGDGGGVWSFVHIEDAASATVAGIDNGRPGIYNIVDDEPAPVREWLPVLAEELGAGPPRRIPRLVGRLLGGQASTIMMTEVRGGSNAKARRELGWQARWSTWRVGFAKGPLVGDRAGALPASAAALVVAAGDSGDPADRAEMADSLSLAFLVLLESLSPQQRAAFLLREVFDYPYDRIAVIVATSEQNARQLVARARRLVAERRPRFEPSSERRRHLATRFSAAARDGDLGALEELLAHDVALHGAGLAGPVAGRVRVARTLVAGLRTLGNRLGGVAVREVSVNGQPGAELLDPSERLIAVVALDIAAGGVIRQVASVSDRDQLRHLGPLADLGALRGRGTDGEPTGDDATRVAGAGTAGR